MSGENAASRVRLGGTFRCAMQSVGVTAVGLSVGKRGVGRSGRCRARWWSGPVVEGRGVARTCGSMMELDTTRRSAAQAERAAAVGRLVGRRRVGRSGRRGARRRKGPMAEERGAARSSGVKQAAAGDPRHNPRPPGHMLRRAAHQQGWSRDCELRELFVSTVSCPRPACQGRAVAAAGQLVS